MTFLTESVAILHVKLVDIVLTAVSLSQKVCLQRVRSNREHSFKCETFIYFCQFSYKLICEWPVQGCNVTKLKKET